jgi:hypothetical protein
MKNKILRLTLLAVGVIIILLSMYYLNKYLETSTTISTTTSRKNAKQIEQFGTYQPVYTGEPLTIDFNSDIITNAKNPKLGIDGLRYVSCNSKSSKLLAIVIDNPGNTMICSYDNTNLKWVCLYADINNISGSIPNFTKINPSTTLPQQNNNITCSQSNGYLLAVNTNIFFYYNQNINNAKKLNCLYYLNLLPIPTTQSSTQNISVNLNCLALPTLTQPTMTTSNGALPNLSYDKLRLLCTNDYVILAMGCSNTLYYYPLVDGSPSSSSSWNTFQCGVVNSTIKYIGINDTTAFIYAYDPNSLANTKIIYSSISVNNNNLVSNWQTWISATSPPIIPNPNPLGNLLLNLTVNNDVMWAIDTGDTNGNVSLWWCPLKNGLPNIDRTGSSYVWQQLPVSRITGINNIVIYKNQLILYLYSNKNLIVPLYKSSATGTTIANQSGTDSTTSTTIANLSGSDSSTTTITIAPTSGSDSSTTTTTIAPTSGSDSSTITTTIANLSGTGSTTTTTIANPSGTDATTTTIANPSGTGSTTTRSLQTTIPNTTHQMTNNVSSISSSGNCNIVPASLSGMFGLNENYNNKNNLNDFLANTNLVGNNLYISPMNNPELYNPTQPKINGKISSSFFPMVKIA